MKAAFITSLASALMSLIAILGLSAITIVPREESWRGRMMLVSGVLFLVWISLALWLRPRPSLVSLPRWGRGLLVLAGAAYILGVLLFVIG